MANGKPGRPKIYFTEEARKAAYLRTQHNRRAILFSRGLCIYGCGDPHRPGKRTCQGCADYLRMQNDARRRKLKSALVCSG